MKTVLTLLLAVVLLGAVAAAGYLVYTRQKATPPPAPVASSASPKDPQKPEDLIRDPNNPLQQELKNSTADLATLKKLLYEIGKNEDTVAWLTVPGTSIDNSVVQAHNNSYYLRRDGRGNQSLYGCYFADYECALGDAQAISQNTILYGHSDLKDNPDGPKFSQLFRYVDPAFAKENAVISLTVPEATLEYEIFAVFYTDTTFNYIYADYTPEAFATMTKQAVALSVQDFGILPTPQDKLLTLSTCGVKQRSDGEGRFVVMARLKG